MSGKIKMLKHLHITLLLTIFGKQSTYFQFTAFSFILDGVLLNSFRFRYHLSRGLPGKTLPRMAAVLLIIFSGIWPHLKLLLLNLTWIFGKHPSRTSALQWLSTLGKWSLADVLVVCVMVGVLHLDWIVEPADIKAGLITDLPQILAIVKNQYTKEQLCDKLLKMTCSKERRVVNKAKCTGMWYRLACGE
jgi:hypothetical protein